MNFECAFAAYSLTISEVLMKRFFALLLCLVTVLALFSCKKSEDDTPTDPTEESNNYGYSFPQNIPDEDYGGKSFRFLEWGDTGGSHWSAFEFIYNESLEGDVVNDAVRERDRIFEEKYNVSIEYIVKNKGDLTSFASQCIDAGSDDFDVFFPTLSSIGSLAISGRLYDLSEFSDIFNFDESWWDTTACKQLSIGGHLFFTTSDLTLVDKNSTWAIFFTKELLDKYPDLLDGYDSIQDMVKKGDWTIEKMYEMCSAVQHDDGDGEWTENDTYGRYGEGFDAGALMVGCGSVITEKNSEDIPQYVWSSHADEYVTSFEYVNKIMSTDCSMTNNALKGYDDIWVDGVGGMMEKGQLLFNCTGMNRCRLYRGLDIEFGIIPMPKANSEQESYHSFMSMGQGNCVAIPISCSDPEATAKLLEAYTCLASQTTYTAYVDKALQYKYLPYDENSKDMLEIIFNNRLFDPVDVYGWGSGNGSIYQGKASGLVSRVKTFEKVTTKMMNSRINQMFEALANQG